MFFTEYTKVLIMPHQRFDLLIVGPSADYTFGSLLRSLNIWYAVEKMVLINTKYISIKSISHVLIHIRSLVAADIVIISGVSPWVAAFITILRRLLGKNTIVDIHGFAWYEALASKCVRITYRIILLISELLAYRSATYVIVASRWLNKILNKYLGINSAFVLQNTITPIFKRFVKELDQYDANLLRKFVCSKILGLKKYRGYIFVAPLPRVFISNMLALKALLKLIDKIPRDVIVVVTGFEDKENHHEQLIYTGYLTYPRYTALLLSSDAIILPYPSNAICGGVRNKVLEAGYCKKPIVSTRVGMMHIQALPGVHYISIDIMSEETVQQREKWNLSALKLYEVIVQQYSFLEFKRSLFKFLKSILGRVRNGAKG